MPVMVAGEGEGGRGRLSMLPSAEAYDDEVGGDWGTVSVAGEGGGWLSTWPRAEALDCGDGETMFVVAEGRDCLTSPTGSLPRDKLGPLT